MLDAVPGTWVTLCKDRRKPIVPLYLVHEVSGVVQVRELFTSYGGRRSRRKVVQTEMISIVIHQQHKALVANTLLSWLLSKTIWYHREFHPTRPINTLMPG